MKVLCLTVEVSHGTTLKRAIKDAVKLKKELDLEAVSFTFNDIDIEIAIDPVKLDFIIKYFTDAGVSMIMNRKKKVKRWISC